MNNTLSNTIAAYRLLTLNVRAQSSTFIATHLIFSWIAHIQFYSTIYIAHYVYACMHCPLYFKLAGVRRTLSPQLISLQLLIRLNCPQLNCIVLAALTFNLIATIVNFEIYITAWIGETSFQRYFTPKYFIQPTL